MIFVWGKRELKRAENNGTLQVGQLSFFTAKVIQQLRFENKISLGSVTVREA